MNVILDYLETMFRTYPQTPRLLEAKGELRAMMEDAYADLIARGASENEAVGRVIADFGNLDELADALGISSEISPAVGGRAAVTLSEAQGFAEAQRRTRFRAAAAVALMVLSPIPLLIMIALDRAGTLAMPEDASVAIGVVTLLLIAAAGVVLFIGAASASAPYARLQRGLFALDPAVTRWADDLAATHEPQRARALKIAVSLWVLSAVPILAAVLATAGAPATKDSWIVGSIPLTLVMIAVGLLVLLPSAWARTVSDTINRVGHRSR